MILEYLKHLKRKWYIFLLAVLVIGGAAYFVQSYLYAKEKGGAGKGTAPEQQGNKGCGPAGKKARAEQRSEEAVHPDLLFGRPE